MTKAVMALVTLVAVGAVTAWWLAAPRSSHTSGHAAVPIATATVTRTTLVTTTQLSGTLGYAGTYPVTSRLTGTITALPLPGVLVTRGRRLYEVDGRGVFLFIGSRPSWRRFAFGMAPGPDVRELERNLTALGYGNGVTVDDRFTWFTDEAVRAWQSATGQPVTGIVELGRIVFAPTSLRVTGDSAALGAMAQPGQPVLTASSPDPVVTVPVPATRTYLIHRADRVTVTVPSGATTTGRVSEISPVAAADTGGDPANGSNGPPEASVPMTVTLDDPSIAAHLDQAPVTITVLDREVRNVLAVPITALVALAGGGYAVWVKSQGAPRSLVPVTPGLFANTLVQVTTPDLHAGDRIEVPTP